MDNADKPAHRPSRLVRSARTMRALSHAPGRRAPSTSLTGPIADQRHLAVLRYPIAELRAAAHAHGCTINDLLIAAVTTDSATSSTGGENQDRLELLASVLLGHVEAARAACSSLHCPSVSRTAPSGSASSRSHRHSKRRRIRSCRHRRNAREPGSVGRGLGQASCDQPYKPVRDQCARPDVNLVLCRSAAAAGGAAGPARRRCPAQRYGDVVRRPLRSLPWPTTTCPICRFSQLAYARRSRATSTHTSVETASERDLLLPRPTAVHPSRRRAGLPAS